MIGDIFLIHEKFPTGWWKAEYQQDSTKFGLIKSSNFEEIPLGSVQDDKRKSMIELAPTAINQQTAVIGKYKAMYKFEGKKDGELSVVAGNIMI